MLTHLLTFFHDLANNIFHANTQANGVTDYSVS
jgi:hypothetical protein